MNTMTPPKAALVVLAVAIVVVLFISLAHALGISEFWAGFLWLFYWAAIEHMDFKRLIPSILGALLGLATGAALRFLPESLGSISELNIGLTLSLCLIVGLVFSTVMGWFTLLVNNATMLFLTVMTISHIQHAGDFLQILGALLLGIAFFGGLLWLATMLAKKFTKQTAE